MCFVLARYLAAPVDRLRLATRRLANGDLNVRVLPALRRRDDLGLLAADLDAMAERLRQLLDGKQQLLRDVSHELRSPLARLQLALSLAGRDRDATERHLARAILEANRLELLLARTLKLARLEEPSSPLAQESVDVAALLRTIAADVAIEADAQGCHVALRLAGPLPVQGDEELLRSAFENLLRNAVHYSPHGGEVAIEARATAERRIEVTVRDQGPGVPYEGPRPDIRAVLPRRGRTRASQRRRGGAGTCDSRARDRAARGQDIRRQCDGWGPLGERQPAG